MGVLDIFTGGKKKKVTIGYWYSFGIHMGICRGPVDELVEIRVGDRTAWQGSVKSSASFSIRRPDLFGGEKREGGIDGTFRAMMGEDDQPMNAAIYNRIVRDQVPPSIGKIPAFRRVFTAYFNGKIAAMNPYPKPWSFRVRRALKGWKGDKPWYPEKAVIHLADGQIAAMNPAHIVYECMTNNEWGRGLPESVIDEESFRDCADKLYDEKFGLCIRWSRKGGIRSFVQTVLDHIGGALSTDRSTGLIKMKLIRGDYVASSLPLYTTENGLLEITEAMVASNASAVNQVEVGYVDPITGEDRAVRVHNLAAIQASGGAINSVTKKYPGLPTAELALRVAQRDLQTAAFPLRRFQLVFDRSAWRLAPGDLIRIHNPARGLDNLVLRVGRMEDGTLTNGRITITAVQDIFSFPLSSFASVEPPRWAPPDTDPALKRWRVFEVPYFLLARNLDRADLAFIEDDEGYLGSVVEKPTPLSIGYDLAVSAEPTTEPE